MKTLKNKMAWQGTAGHTPKGVSETIQGDVLPMSKILQRFASGIDIPRESAVYGDVEDDEHESEDLMKVRDFDLVDKDEIKKQRIELIEVIEKKKKQYEDEENKKLKNTPQSPAE
jgi:hypothetical protein